MDASEAKSSQVSSPFIDDKDEYYHGQDDFDTESDVGVPRNSPGIDVRKNLKTVLETPEKLLRRAKRKAKAYAAKKEMDNAVDELIKCIAWVRIIYGEPHWRTAQAEMALSEAYFDLKDYYQQAAEHAEVAKDIVFSLEHVPRSQDKQTEILRILIRSCLILGKVWTLHSKLQVAEQNLFQAQHLFADYVKCEANEKRRVDLHAKILSGIARLFAAEKQFSKATSTWRKITEIVANFYGNESKELVVVHASFGEFLANDARQNDEAAEEFKKAHYIATIRFGGDSTEGLDAELSLAKTFISLKSKLCLSWAEQHLRHIITATRDDETRMKLHLAAEDRWIPLLLLGNKEHEAVEQLTSTLKFKIEHFGEFSKRSITAHKMLASLYLSSNQPDLAAKLMKECLDLENVALGSDDPTTKETAFALRVILKNPDVSKELRIRERCWRTPVS